MVPESVDERIIEEHLLRDRFYNLDYTSMSPASAAKAAASAARAAASSSFASSVSAFLDQLLVVIVAFFILLAVYAFMRGIRRRKDSSSPILPYASSPPYTSSPTFASSTSTSSSAASSPALSSSSLFSSSSLGVGARDKYSKPSGAFEKLYSLMTSEDRLRQD
ncbi:hypothetical protein BZA70DRAFT_291020 [Myxozyma melibiosi]|uniref:Uncharacterized protein n=1 Tax=Myxozyma melibiosi TaxID=54550 RepID=A0ABR1F484_9ASCO